MSNLAVKLREVSEALKAINEQAKQLRDAKKSIEAELFNHMKQTNTLKTDAGEGYTVELVTKPKAQPLNEEFLDFVCKQFLGEKGGDEIVNQIYDAKAEAATTVEKIKLNAPRKRARG